MTISSFNLSIESKTKEDIAFLVCNFSTLTNKDNDSKFLHVHVPLSLFMIKTSLKSSILTLITFIGLCFSVGYCNEYSTTQITPQTSKPQDKTSNVPDLKTTQGTRTTQSSLKMNFGKFHSDPTL